MASRKNDNFDVGIKKYMKFKPIDFDRVDGGFDGIYFDRRDNIVVFIKKTGEELKNNGLYLLQPNEGLSDWINNILKEMSDKYGKLYSELNLNVVNNIKQAISEEKFRVLFIYNFTKYETGNPNYIVSELKKDNTWHYENSFEYVKRVEEKLEIVESARKNRDEKEKQKYSRIIGLYREEDANYPTKNYLEKCFQNEFQEFLDISYKKMDYKKRFNILMMGIAREITAYSFVSYYLDNNQKKLIDGLYTRQRLISLMYVANKLDYSAHLYDLVYAVSINDKKLIEAFLKNLPGPFDDEFNKVWKILTKSLYLIFDKNKTQEKIDEVRDEIKRILELKSVQQYLKSFLKCFYDIINHDYDFFSEHVTDVLKSHDKIDSFYDRVGYVSLYSLAFYNLAYFDKDRKTPMPAEPVHPLWDSELWHEIIKDNQKREYIIDIEKVSPVLKRWMDTLPAKIDFEELG